MSSPSHKTHDVRRGAAERRHVRAAVLAALGLVLVTVAVFVGTGWLTSHYELRGVFSNAHDLLPGSPVRIAGVDVGQVSTVAAGPRNTAIVSMQINDSGRPIHTNATLAIEPRLILEGSFYVNLDPGTPGASALPSGAAIALSRTTVPVQIDQVLDTFDLATRGALQQSVHGLASGLGGGTSPAPTARAPAGYGGLRHAVRALDGSLASITQVAYAAQGTQPGDLDRTVRYSRDFTSELAQNPAALARLVANFNTVTGVLAAEDRPLAASVQRLDDVLRVAPPSLAALDAALPALTSFSDALDPALRAAPAPLRKTDEFMAQVQRLVGSRELPALLDQLAPVTKTLPPLERGLRGLLPLVTPINQCLSTHVIPTLDQKLQDGSNSTGDPAWLDLLHGATGVTSVTGGFDGNGVALRIGLTVGPSVLGGILPGFGQLTAFGAPIEGVRPTWLGYGVWPAYRPDQWCTKQPLPNVNARSGPAPSWDTAVAPTPGRRAR
jgi:phospholipid/cholesterol/gamma-HCH transport system substrate-binding protein